MQDSTIFPGTCCNLSWNLLQFTCAAWEMSSPNPSRLSRHNAAVTQKPLPAAHDLALAIQRPGAVTGSAANALYDAVAVRMKGLGILEAWLHAGVHGLTLVEGVLAGHPDLNVGIVVHALGINLWIVPPEIVPGASGCAG